MAANKLHSECLARRDDLRKKTANLSERAQHLSEIQEKLAAQIREREHQYSQLQDKGRADREKIYRKTKQAMQETTKYEATAAEIAGERLQADEVGRAAHF